MGIFAAYEGKEQIGLKVVVQGDFGIAHHPEIRAGGCPAGVTQLFGKRGVNTGEPRDRGVVLTEAEYFFAVLFHQRVCRHRVQQKITLPVLDKQNEIGFFRVFG